VLNKILKYRITILYGITKKLTILVPPTHNIYSIVLLLDIIFYNPFL